MEPFTFSQLRKCLDRFDFGIVKKLRKFQYWAKKLLYRIKKCSFLTEVGAKFLIK